LKPLFRWAGGKTKLLKDYHNAGVFPKNFKKYHEPFLGGGAVFIDMYKMNPDAEFYLNDINQDIMDIYRAIKRDVNSFCDHVDRLQKKYLSHPAPIINAKSDPEERKKERARLDQIYKQHQLPKFHIHKYRKYNWSAIYMAEPSRRHFYFLIRDLYAWCSESLDETERSAYLYFLMKTSFNGIWQANRNTNGKFGTPSGLLDEKGSIYDKDNVKQWHKALQKCQLRSWDYRKEIADIGAGSFVFLDPPYRDSFADYDTPAHDIFQEEVVEFFEKAKSKGAYTVLCNRESPDGFFKSRQRDNEMKMFPVAYTVGRRKKSSSRTYSILPHTQYSLDGTEEIIFQFDAPNKEVTKYTAVHATEILMIGLDSKNKSCYINNINKQE